MINLVGTNYKLVWTQLPASSHDEEMPKALAEVLARELKDLGSPNVVVKIGEYHCGRSEFTWEIKLISEISAKKTHTLFCTSATQQYAARHNGLEKVDESYFGRINVDVAMYGGEDENGIQIPDKFATTVARLAHSHYCELIYKYYPDWTTAYIDAPQYSSAPIDRAWLEA